MSPIVLIVMGVMTAAAIALLVWAGAALLAPGPKARRAALAALIGGSIGFTTTALVQGPFYHDAKADAAPLTPLILAALAALVMALLAAWMILKAPAPRKPEA
jgi:predicted permease